MNTPIAHGEIRTASQLRAIGFSKSQKHVWLICPTCGLGRWIQIRTGLDMTRQCKPCKYGPNYRPILGEDERRNERGRLLKSATCKECDKQRWVRASRGEPVPALCEDCSKRSRRGVEAGYWKGGRLKVGGYIRAWLAPDDAFFSMADSKGYVAEHRLVMARYLGRPLDDSEIVHHVNGVKDDNRLENLCLTTKSTHRLSYQAAYTEGFQDGARNTSRELEEQVRLLRWQIKELSQQLAVGGAPSL